jgi:2-isopropylmalate synthase
VKAEAAGAVARAKSYLDDVEFSPEDGYRSDPDFMCEVCQIAVDNGATTLNIPDTVGFAVPDDYGKLIKYVIEGIPLGCVFALVARNLGLPHIDTGARSRFQS